MGRMEFREASQHEMEQSGTLVGTDQRDSVIAFGRRVVNYPYLGSMADSAEKSHSNFAPVRWEVGTSFPPIRAPSLAQSLVQFMDSPTEACWISRRKEDVVFTQDIACIREVGAYYR